MSGVVDIQRRLRELGRIRMGEKRVSQKSGKEYPAAIDRFRFTSPSRGILERMAAVVGGDVKVWDGAPDGEQFELYSTTNQIKVVIPPVQEPYSQSYELWSGAGCIRRCNGETAVMAVGEGKNVTMRERACVCDPDNRECKLTTRASFILPWAPSLGVWRLESHGYNAAVELTGTLEYLAAQASQGVFIEATLRLEQRSKRVPGQPTSEYIVPVLDTELTPAELIGAGTVTPTPALPRGHRPELPPAPNETPAGPDAEFTDPGTVDGDPGWGEAPSVPTGEEARKPEDDRPITDAQRRRLFAIAKSSGVNEEMLRAMVAHHRGDDNTSTDGLTRAAYERLVADLEAAATNAA